MIKKPHIKILVLNWNGQKIIGECIDSLKNLNYSNYSIDIIDNGSTDHSIKIIMDKYPDINLHILNKNKGYAKGYNSIFNKLKDNNNIEHYLILNNDTVVTNNFLDKLYLSSIKNGFNHIYGPKIRYLNKDRLWFSGGYYNKYLGFTKHIGIRESEDNIFYKTRETDYISGCCMLIKKKLIDELKGFSKIYNMYYEDVDLCYRASLLGIKCYIVEDSLIFHNVSYTIGNNSIRKIYYQFSSRLKFIFKFNNIVVSLFSLLINLFLIPFNIIKIFYKA